MGWRRLHARDWQCTKSSQCFYLEEKSGMNAKSDRLSWGGLKLVLKSTLYAILCKYSLIVTFSRQLVERVRLHALRRMPTALH